MRVLLIALLLNSACQPTSTEPGASADLPDPALSIPAGRIIDLSHHLANSRS